MIMVIKVQFYKKKNPYINRNTGNYSIKQLRNLLADYLEGDMTILENYIDIAKAEIGSLQNDHGKDFINNKDINLTEDENHIVRRYKFMLNKNNNDFLTNEEIRDQLRYPNNADNETSHKEKRKRLGIGKYYWGDEIAVMCFEEIFQMKIVLITQPSEGTQLTINKRVKFKRKIENTYRYGTLMSKNYNTHTGSVILDNYEIINEIPLQDIIMSKRYTIYNVIYPEKNEKSMRNFKKCMFMLYYSEGVGHYEAIYKRPNNPRLPEKYIFELDKLPSYINYMIFLASYGFQGPSGTYFGPQDSTIYNKINALTPKLNTIYKLYANQLLENKGKNKIEVWDVNKGSNKWVEKLGNPPPNIQIQMGGRRRRRENNNIQDTQGIKKYVSHYLENNPGALDSKNTYYVVIDLKLYPGDTIPNWVKVTSKM